MKVLLNGLQAGNLSGTGQYTTQLARWLPGLAEDVEIAVLWPKGTPIPDGTAVTDDTTFLQHDTRVFLRRLVLDQFGIRRLSERIQADLVHFPASVGNQLGAPNMVVTIHDLSFLHDARWFRQDRAVYYRATIGRGAKAARRVIADSRATASDLTEKLGIPEDRIDVVPLGVDGRFRRASEGDQILARTKYRLPDHFFLYVGTIEPRKNLARVIEAWSRVARDCPHALVIAGRDGWKVEPIRTAAAKAPHAERIHFTGFIEQDDLPAVYSCADAFVWPSLWEGFGLPPLEAMACGVPVLTSNVASLPEVVGDAALQVDPLDVQAIAEGMRRIVTEAKLRSSLLTTGLARAAQFTWKRAAELTLASYRAAFEK